MSHTTVVNRSSRFSVFNFLAAPFIGLGRFLVLLAEANPKMRQLERLGRISDQELAEQGKTREEEIRRIMGVSAYL